MCLCAKPNWECEKLPFDSSIEYCKLRGCYTTSYNSNEVFSWPQVVQLGMVNVADFFWPPLGVVGDQGKKGVLQDKLHH